MKYLSIFIVTFLTIFLTITQVHAEDHANWINTNLQADGITLILEDINPATIIVTDGSFNILSEFPNECPSDYVFMPALVTNNLGGCGTIDMAFGDYYFISPGEDVCYSITASDPEWLPWTEQTNCGGLNFTALTNQDQAQLALAQISADFSARVGAILASIFGVLITLVWLWYMIKKVKSIFNY